MIAKIAIVWGEELQSGAGKKSSAQRLEALDYVEAMLIQLQPMAATNGFPVLAHLLEMARIEANDNAVAIRSGSSDADDRDKAAGVAL